MGNKCAICNKPMDSDDLYGPECGKKMAKGAGLHKNVLKNKKELMRIASHGSCPDHFIKEIAELKDPDLNKALEKNLVSRQSKTSEKIESATNRLYYGSFEGISPAIKDNSFFFNEILSDNSLEQYNADGELEYVDLDELDQRLTGNENIHMISGYISRKLIDNPTWKDSVYFVNNTPYLIIPNNHQNYEKIAKTILDEDPDYLNANSNEEKFFDSHWHGTVDMKSQLDPEKNPNWSEHYEKIMDHFDTENGSAPYNYELVSERMGSFLEENGYCVLDTVYGKVWCADTLGIHYGSREDFKKLIKKFNN